MADGDLALHAERDRPIRDLAQLRRARLAAVVEMNVDALAGLFRETEQDVELALHVAVETPRVETANEIRARRERGGEQIGRARLGGDAALWEGDDLDVDPVAKSFAHR